MKELTEYREKLIKRFDEAAGEFCAACEVVKDPFQKVADGWNLHQVASHTRDVQKLVYVRRIEQTLKEDVPLFENFEADEWMAAHYNPQEPLAGILDEFTNDVNELCVLLSGLTPRDWSRESNHVDFGNG